MRKPLVFVISISFLFGLLAGILFFNGHPHKSEKHYRHGDQKFEKMLVKKNQPVQDTQDEQLSVDLEPDIESEGAAKIFDEHSQISVWQTDTGLYVDVRGEQQLLAVKGEAALDGMYTAISTASVSPAGTYVHFCQKETVDTTDCAHYLYDIEKNGIYKVTFNNEPLETDSNTLAFSWNNSNGLKINNLVSAQTLQPWILVTE